MYCLVKTFNSQMYNFVKIDEYLILYYTTYNDWNSRYHNDNCEHKFTSSSSFTWIRSFNTYVHITHLIVV